MRGRTVVSTPVIVLDVEMRGKQVFPFAVAASIVPCTDVD